MAFPKFIKPIQVRFLTDYVRSLQLNGLSGPLKNAAGDLVNDVMTRDNIDRSVALALTRNNEKEYDAGAGAEKEGAGIDDPLLSTLENVVNGIMTGESLAGEQKEIQRYIFNQQERAELISNLLLTKDYGRLVSSLRVRDVLEKKLLDAALREDLNTSELMAMMTIIGSHTEKLENRVQAGATNISDVMALLNKADFALHVHEDVIKEKFKNTSSTGREIVRRMIHKLQKVDKAASDKK
jgi:hypothetical protein